jgi:hypothetical protein
MQLFPVLLSVQRIALLYRKYCLNSAWKADPIKSQTDALLISHQQRHRHRVKEEQRARVVLRCCDNT